MREKEKWQANTHTHTHMCYTECLYTAGQMKKIGINQRQMTINRIGHVHVS